MPKEDDTPTTPPSTGQPVARILKANYVELPLDAPPPTDKPDPHEEEFLKIRASYFAGETLTPQQLQKMMLRATETSGGGGNGNCNIC